MGIQNIYNFPFDLEDYLYDFYHDNFIDSGFQDIVTETETETETCKGKIQSQSNVNSRGTNSLVYSASTNKMSKRAIAGVCPEFVSTQDCFFNAICASISLPRVVVTERVGFTSMPEDNVFMYARFLKYIENNTDEGRWSRPAKDANGKIQWVVEFIDANGSIRSKTHNVEGEDLVVNEGTELNPELVTYTPKMRLSNAVKVANRVKVKDLNGKYRQQWASAFQLDEDGKPTRVIDNRWYVHYDSANLPTLGFGHLIDKKQKNYAKVITVGTEVFKSNWDDFYGDGLTDNQIVELFAKDVNLKIKNVQNIIGAKRWNYLCANCPEGIIALIEVSYNTKKGVRGFPSMCAAMCIPQIPLLDAKGNPEINPTTGNIVYTGKWTEDFTPIKGCEPDLNKIAIELQRTGTGNRDEMVRQIFIKQILTTFRTLGADIRKDIVPDSKGIYLKKAN
jgi:hypothetical protein